MKGNRRLGPRERMLARRGLAEPGELEEPEENDKEPEKPMRGIFMVQNFRRVRPERVQALRDKGTKVHHVRPYLGGPREESLWFTGDIVWKDTKHREWSCINGTLRHPNVPGGTLIIAIDND